METKNNIQGNTFSPLYDELEDRIRLTINYQDYENRVDLLITRGILIRMIPIINDFIGKYYNDFLSAKKDNEEFIEEINEVKYLKNDEKPKVNSLSIVDNSDLNFMKKEDELLVKVDLTYNVNSKKTTLVLHSNSFKVVSILDYGSLNSVINTIKFSVPIFRWGLSKSFLDFG